MTLVRRIPLLLLLFWARQIHGQDISVVIAAKAVAIQPKLAEWRRQLHQHPELANSEFKTSAFISEHLKRLGMEVTENVAKTGVVAILKGGKPGPVMALRSDMDALPVKERVNVPFASVDSADYFGQRVPVMHACGHDAHIAMLLGTAEVLAAMKKDIHGTVKFIFQPAEEGVPAGIEGGASLMVKEGVMENPKVDVIFGMHIESWIPAGEIRYKAGAFMASSDWFRIKVKGRSTHGGKPWLGIDPIAIASQIIGGLQLIVSRQAELTKGPVVITVGKIAGGSRNNIIPEECILDGTIRTFDEGMKKDVWARIKNTAEKIAEAGGATATVSFDNKTLVTFNDPVLIEKMIPSFRAAAGADHVKTMDWITEAEDFSYYGTKAPALFFHFGGMPVGFDTNTVPPNHSPDFTIDDSKLYVGVKTFCQMVFDYPGTVKN